MNALVVGAGITGLLAVAIWKAPLEYTSCRLRCVLTNITCNWSPLPMWSLRYLQAWVISSSK